MEEIFKQIEDYPNYEVSNFGRIRTKSRPVRYVHSVTKKELFRQTEEAFLKIYYNKQGYKFVQLYKDKKSKNLTIHRLVAKAFVKQKDITHTVVNHIDGNKLNNRFDNLEWCTNSYNHEHAVKNNLKAYGSRIGTSKLNENMAHAIKWFLNKGFSHSELSKAFNVSRASIYLISQSKAWKHIALTGEELTLKD